MGEAAPNYEPIPGPRQHDLTMVGTDGEREEAPEQSRDDESKSLYPDLHFSIPDRKLINTDASVIPVTETSRLRTVLHELKYATQDSRELRDRGVAEEFNRYYTDIAYREQQLASATRYLDERVTIGAKLQKRRDVIDVKRAIQDAYSSLLEENHPTGQIMKYILTSHGNRLTDREGTSLFLDLLAITSWEQLHLEVEGQVKEAQLTAVENEKKYRK